MSSKLVSRYSLAFSLFRPHVIAALVGTALCPSTPPPAGHGAVADGGAAAAADDGVAAAAAAAVATAAASPPPTHALRFAEFKEALARVALYAAEQPGSSTYFPLSFEAKLRAFLAAPLRVETRRRGANVAPTARKPTHTQTHTRKRKRKRKSTRARTHTHTHTHARTHGAPCAVLM